MTVAEQLRAAKALIADPERWFKYAQREREEYCAFTALRKVLPAGVLVVNSAARRQLATAGPTKNITEFNDCASHAEVMAWFDRAIALAESEDA